MRNECKPLIWNEGFTQEHRIYKALIDDGWDVLPNRYYLETQSSSAEEYDLLAYKTFTTGLTTFWIVLTIECKHASNTKIVFYERRKDEPNTRYPLIHIVGDGIKNKVSQRDLQSALGELKRGKSTFFSNDQVMGCIAFNEEKEKANKGVPIGKDTYTLKKADKVTNNIRTGIRTAAAAARYEKHTRSVYKVSTLNDAYVFFPLVILKGDTYKALFGKIKTVSQADSFMFMAGLSSEDEPDYIADQHYVHVINESRLKETLRVFNELMTKFTVMFKKKIKSK